VASPASEPTNVSVRSISGQQSRRPIVVLSVGETETQMSPGKAREVALLLLEGADAAESDTFIGEFVRRRVGGDEVQAVTLLREFREFRNAERARYFAEDLPGVREIPEEGSDGR